MVIRWGFILLIILNTLLIIPDHGFAQTPEIESSISYSFGNQINFRARYLSQSPVVSANVFINPADESRTSIGEAEVTPAEEGFYDLSFTLKPDENSIRPFSRVNYLWRITHENGEVFDSPQYQFFYEDNRIQWKSLEEKPFQIHWDEGDTNFAQGILDTAQEGLKEIQSILPLRAPESLDIYVYPGDDLLQSALLLESLGWVAGHADPKLGVVIVSLPSGPEQWLLTQQRIPHEIMHILLFQEMQQGYRYLPTWLSEGLASMAELYPNPDYRAVLEDATQRKALLPISSMCLGFPRLASSAFLSYAQSASFVNFLHNQYGTSGLKTLLAAYSNGLDCDRGLEQAFGKNLSQLERQWRSQDLSDYSLMSSLDALAPWLILLLAILAAPIIISLYKIKPSSRKKVTESDHLEDLSSK